MIKTVASPFAWVALLAGCVATPQAGLDDYVKGLDYVPFVVPRATDGAGTVIDFKNRSESIVARTGDCLTRTKPFDIPSRKVGTTDIDRKVDWSAGTSASIPTSIIKYADISALVKASGAKSVKVSLKEPFEQYITRLQFITYLNELPSSDPCRGLFADPNNLIIYQAFGAKSVSYQLLDSSDNAISLTAKILDQVDLKPELRRAVQETGKLESNEILLLGYRTWVVTKPAGVIGTGLDVAPVPTKDVETRREASR